MNEYIFITHALLLSCGIIIATYLGQEALIAYATLQAILMNLFVMKQITLFGFEVTATDAFAIGLILTLNVLQEFYGKKNALKAIWITFACSIAYALFSQIHLLYIPSLFDINNGHFIALLTSVPRIVIASLLTFLMVLHTDATLYAWLKKFFNGRFFILRSALSVFICQLLDTILFSFLGLYGLVPHIWHIIFLSFTIKLISISISLPIVSFGKVIIQSIKS